MAEAKSSRNYRIGIKRLAPGEVDLDRSHQHELNGVSSLRTILGTSRMTNIKTRWILLRDDGEHRDEVELVKVPLDQVPPLGSVD